MAGKILTLKQVGEILGVTDRTIQNLIERGDMRGFRVGGRWRVEESELPAYIERQTNKVDALKQRQPDVMEMIAHVVRGLPDGVREEVEAELINILTEHKHLNLTYEQGQPHITKAPASEPVEAAQK